MSLASRRWARRQDSIHGLILPLSMLTSWPLSSTRSYIFQGHWSGFCHWPGVLPQVHVGKAMMNLSSGGGPLSSWLSMLLCSLSFHLFLSAQVTIGRLWVPTGISWAVGPWQSLQNKELKQLFFSHRESRNLPKGFGGSKPTNLWYVLSFRGYPYLKSMGNVD